jgi:ATP-dependent protease Clp ATPase subunit
LNEHKSIEGERLQTTQEGEQEQIAKESKNEQLKAQRKENLTRHGVIPEFI